MEYNSKRTPLIIPEYGRSIHKMIAFACKVEDRAERNHIARSIVKVMGQVNIQYKESEDFIQKLWDHLFIISDFKLDVDSPYPVPSPEILAKKPKKVSYPNRRIKYRHYGDSIQKFVEKACTMEDSDERTAFTYYIANMMKKNYLMYNRESVSDDLIFDQLGILSKGVLRVKSSHTLKSTNELLDKPRNTNNNNQRRSSNQNNGPRKKTNKKRTIR